MTKEVEAFMRKARRSLKASEILLRQGFVEDAVARAYFGTLSAAKAMLLVRGRKPTKHKHVAREFERLFIESGTVEPKFLSFLQGGFISRHFADYETDLTHPISAEDAEGRLKAATEFVTMAEQFLRGAGGNSE